MSFNINTTNNDVWLTPPELIQRLGEFDLDPCSPLSRPWDTAKHHFTIIDDGLLQQWFGRVWLNPPYGKQLAQWLNKMALHANGIALTFGRFDTAAFHDFVFPFAESIFFIKGRLSFYDYKGLRSENSGAASVLISYDEQNADAIADSGLKGAHIYLKGEVFYFGIDNNGKSWRVIVGEVLIDLGKSATLSEIYEAVVKKAPSRISKNRHYMAKVRQVLQVHYTRIEKGKYSHG